MSTANSNANIKQSFKTRLSQGGEQFTTVCEFDFTGVSMEQLQQLALRSLVINAQSCYRTGGNVPQKDCIIVADMLARERNTGGRTPTVATVAKNINKMRAEDRAAMIKLLQGED